MLMSLELLISPTNQSQWSPETLCRVRQHSPTAEAWLPQPSIGLSVTHPIDKHPRSDKGRRVAQPSNTVQQPNFGRDTRHDPLSAASAWLPNPATGFSNHSQNENG